MQSLPEFSPNLRKVEVELTTRCNLMCQSCDRRCTQAPAKEDMLLSQVHHFVEESTELHYLWREIVLLGGEPTLHPRFREIVKVVVEYAAGVGHCEVSVVSNVHGARVRAALELVRDSVRIIERPKKRRSGWFNNVDLAPIDFGQSFTSCQNTSECGLGLTPRGYFPCGAGAAIARVLKMDVGIRSLRDVTENALVRMLPGLCGYCGHALAVNLDEDESVSPFWRQAYNTYRALNRRHQT